VHSFTVRFTAKAGPNPLSAVLCSRNAPHDLRNDRNSRKEIHTHTHANNMYYDAGEEREIGGIKGINQVTCRELGSRRRQYGTGSIIITTARRSISILARCSSFQTPLFLDPRDRKSLLIISEQLRNNKRAAQEHQRLLTKLSVSLPPAADLCTAVGNLQYPLPNPLTNLSLILKTQHTPLLLKG